MKKLLVALLVFTGVFALAACGADDDTQGVFEDRVVVGNAAATSGGFAAVGVPFNSAIEAYFAMVNEDGGIAGRELEFVHYDDEFDGAQGLTYTQRLVEDDQVFALVGHFGTPTVGATHDYLNELGVPRVYYATGISQLFNPAATGGERYSFPVQPIYDAEGEVMVARAVAEYDASKIGVIYTNADDGNGMLNGIELRAQQLGIELVTQQVAPDSSDMSSAANTIVSEDVDAVIVAANQVPAEVAIKALYSASSDAPVFTSYVNAAESFIANLADEIESGQFPIYSNAWVNIFAEDGASFNEGYLQFAEENPDYAANSYAMAGWIAAHFFVEGLRRVGEDELTWETYLEAMESEPVENPMGGIVDFADGRRAGTQSMALLQATVDGETYVWANFRPMEDIQAILD